MAKKTSKTATNNESQAKQEFIDLYGVRLEIYFDNGSGPVSLNSIMGGGSSYIESVSVKIAMMEMFNIEVKLTPPLKQAINLIQSGRLGLGFSKRRKNASGQGKSAGEGVNESKAEFSMNKILIRIHYGGHSSRLFSAILLMPDVSIASDGIDITLKGVGLLFNQSKKSGQMEGTAKGTEAVKRMLGEDVEIIYEKGAEAALSDVEWSNPDTKNAYQSAKEILNAHNCHMIYEGANKLGDKQVVRIKHSKDIRQLNSRANIRLVAFQQINPSARVYPIIGLSSPLTNIVAMGAIAGNKVNVFDKKKKKTTSTNVGNKSYDEKVGAQKFSQDQSVPTQPESNQSSANGEATSVQNSGNPAGSIFGIINDGAGNIESRIMNVMHGWMEKAFEYEVETVGAPFLLPGNVAGISVFGIPALSNDYDIKSVEHNISSSGYETKLECVAMAGLVADLSSGGNKVATAVAEAAGKAVNAVGNKISTSKGVEQP